MDISQNYPGYQLKSELARYCLPMAKRDFTRKLAWTNSICIFFLLIGVGGFQRTIIDIKQPPILEEAVPIVVEPLAPPLPTKIEATAKEEAEPQKETITPVVTVTLNSPAVNFSVPTIGNLVVPQGQAVAPPAEPLKQIVAANLQPIGIGNTGQGGDRPRPDYPRVAKELRQQGTVLLRIVASANGSISSIEIAQSSGSAILDRNSLEFVKRHWILPQGLAGRVFEAPIKYIL